MLKNKLAVLALSAIVLAVIASGTASATTYYNYETNSRLPDSYNPEWLNSQSEHRYVQPQENLVNWMEWNHNDPDKGTLKAWFKYSSNGGFTNGYSEVATLNYGGNYGYWKDVWVGTSTSDYNYYINHGYGPTYWSIYETLTSTSTTKTFTIW